MTINQIKVMDQKTGLGGSESCGYHALKNSLLSLLRQQSCISQQQFESLIINKDFFNDLYNATKHIAQRSNLRPSQTLDEAFTDVSFPVMIELLEAIKSGNIDLTKYHITTDMLSKLPINQDGNQSLSVVNLYTGMHSPAYGLVGMEGDLIAAAAAVKLARNKGAQNHAIVFGLNDQHWVSAVLEQNPVGQRVWQFMDSEHNQTLFKNAAISKIETILEKNENQLQTYLLEVYDAVNSNDFNVQYREYFDSSTGLPHAMPDDIGNVLAQIFFIEDMQNLSKFTGYVQTRFSFMQTAGWLDSKGESEHAHLKQLYAMANFLYSNAKDLNVGAAQLGPICASLKSNLDMPVKKNIEDKPVSVIFAADVSKIKKEEIQQASAAKFAVAHQKPKPAEGFLDSFVNGITFLIENNSFNYAADCIKLGF